MSPVATVAIVAAASMISTVVAAGLGRLGRDRVRASVSAAGVAAGVMLWIAVAEALPEAAGELGWSRAAATAVVAALLVAVAARAAGRLRPGPVGAGTLPALAVALVLHDLPEGVAVGALVVGGSTAAGLALVAVVTAHNVPEKLAVLAPARASGSRLWPPALAVTVPEPLGAGLAVSGAAISPTALAVALAAAGGAMVAVSLDALPDLARRHLALRRFTLTGMGTATLLALVAPLVPA